MPTHDDYVYLACFLDCEGCCQIRRAKYKHHSFTHTARLFVCNTYKPIIEEFHTIFGGTIELHPPQNPNWRMHYRWVIYGRQIAELAPLILPFSRVKHAQLELLLKFQNRVDAYGGSRRSGGVADEEIAWRQEQMDQMKVLNRRGSPKHERDSSDAG